MIFLNKSVHLLILHFTCVKLIFSQPIHIKNFNILSLKKGGREIGKLSILSKIKTAKDTGKRKRFTKWLQSVRGVFWTKATWVEV